MGGERARPSRGIHRPEGLVVQVSRRKYNAGTAIRPGRESKAAANRALKFNKAILDYAKSLGAVDDPTTPFASVQLVTAFGPMRIIPLDTWVACRFLTADGTARAAAHFNAGYAYQRVNLHSGKFNFHCADAPLRLMIQVAIEHIASVPLPEA